MENILKRRKPFKARGSLALLHKKGYAATRGGNQGASDRDLRRLRRSDLLELLIDQVRKNDEQAANAAETAELVERLKAKLDEKDAQISHLEERLDAKDATIAQLKKLQDATGREAVCAPTVSKALHELEAVHLQPAAEGGLRTGAETAEATAALRSNPDIQGFLELEARALAFYLERAQETSTPAAMTTETSKPEPKAETASR